MFVIELEKNGCFSFHANTGLCRELRSALRQVLSELAPFSPAAFVHIGAAGGALAVAVHPNDSGRLPAVEAAETGAGRGRFLRSGLVRPGLAIGW